MLIPSKHCGYQAGIRLYFKKDGGSTPPPDPALIAAQIRSMGIQDSAITSILRNAEAMLPTQMEQMRFGLDSAKQGYQQSQDDRSWMLGRRGNLSGMQDTMINDANSFNSEARQDQLVGEAQSEVNSAFANAKTQQAQALARRGVNPNSGKALALGNQSAIAQASALAGASNRARAAGRQEGYAMTDRATNALAGYPAMGMAATGAGAGLGMAGSGLANSALIGMNAGAGQAAGVAGAMGSNATSMYGAQASYKNAQDQMANQGDPFMNMLGQGAMTWAMSDVNAKEAIDPRAPGEALEKVEAIPVSEWQYKQGEGEDPNQRHTGPMAQDVQRVAGEQVAPGGTKIDLVSLNGLNMAATKDLSRKVDQLTSAVSRLAIKGGIPGANHG
jgi:hypothetical protein